MPLPQRCRWNAPRKPMNCSSRARSSGTSSWSPDLIYGMGMPRESGGMIFIPRPHQLAARDAILGARREGRPGFLLGDLTGLGKTLSVWAALAAMPEDEILVVCPKGGMPQGEGVTLLEIGVGMHP